MEEPNVIQWWLFDACTISFSESIKTWQNIYKAMRNSTNSSSVSSKITSCTLNMMNSLSDHE